MENAELAATVGRARDGDEAAWGGLVEHFDGLLWSIAQGHRLSSADAADVVQTTWLRLLDHIESIREPDRIGAWLATTARHECLRVIRAAGRTRPVEEVPEPDPDAAHDPSPEDSALAAERIEILWLALENIPPRCRQLLRVLMASPPPSYAEISAALEMPIGSIGPTRGRCLDCLRRQMARAASTAVGFPGRPS